MSTQFDYGTGRRKTATARTRLYAGSGNIEINGRPMEQYFPRKTLQMIIRQPLVILDWTGTTTGHSVLMLCWGVVL